MIQSTKPEKPFFLWVESTWEEPKLSAKDIHESLQILDV